MTTLGTDLLDVLDDIRGIPGELGLRPYKVTVLVRTWNGSRPGVDQSTSTDATSVISVDIGSQHPRVRQLTQREIIASAGMYQDQDMRVGPITPPTVGGTDPPYVGATADHSAISVFEPPIGAGPVEIFFKLEGPGMSPGGSYFKKVGQDVTRPLHYEFVVRRTGETP